MLPEKKYKIQQWKIFSFNTIFKFEFVSLTKYKGLSASRPLIRKEAHSSNFHHQGSADIGTRVVAKGRKKRLLWWLIHIVYLLLSIFFLVSIKLQGYKMWKAGIGCVKGTLARRWKKGYGLHCNRDRKPNSARFCPRVRNHSYFHLCEQLVPIKIRVLCFPSFLSL